MPPRGAGGAAAEADRDRIARFWAKVDVSGPGECWPWLAGRRKAGHGKVKWQGRCREAHIVAWLLTRGPPPAGKVLRHLCGNAWCVNPAHLRPGTWAENAADTREHAAMVRTPPPERKRWSKGPEPRPLRERLLENVREDARGCWNWTRAKLKRTGHGILKARGRMLKAHRVSYEVFVGPVPAGKLVRHSCDNSACINPAHLLPGTHADNMRDMAERGRAAKGARNHFGRVAYRGADNARTVLTEEKVRAIRASARTFAEIAAEHGVSVGCVCHVRARRSWKHVE